MSARVPNKVKRIAIKHFQTHINESLYLNKTNCQIKKQSLLTEDLEHRKQDQYVRKCINILTHRKEQKKCSISYLETPPQVETKNEENGKNLQIPKTIHFSLPSCNQLKINKNFIEIPKNDEEQTQRSAMFVRKIDRLRDLKIEIEKGQKVQNNFFSSNHKVKSSDTKRKEHRSLHTKNDQGQYKKQSGQYFMPIGCQTKRVQKLKGDNGNKMNPHFIEMEFYVDPETRCNGIKKPSIYEKNQAQLLSIIEKVASKVSSSMNQKNMFDPVFNASMQKKKKQQQQFKQKGYQQTDQYKKFQMFCNKKENEKVKITQKQLYRFKQMIYLKKEQKDLESQSSLESSEKPEKKKIATQLSIIEEKSEKNKKTINISNIKNYELLIREDNEENNEPKQLGTSTLVKNQRKKIKRVSFQKKGTLNKSVFLENITQNSSNRQQAD